MMLHPQRQNLPVRHHRQGGAIPGPEFSARVRVGFATRRGRVDMLMLPNLQCKYSLTAAQYSIGM